MSDVTDLHQPLLGGARRDQDDNLIDVEAQRQPLAENSFKMGRKPVWCNMSPKAVEQFKADYGIEPILQSSDDEPINEHPHLHAQRCWLEHDALKALNKFFPRPNGLWLDVGSQPKRVLKFEQSRCLVPILQVGDSERFAPYNNEHRVCNHTLRGWLAGNRDNQFACHVCDHNLKYDALLFVHSAYYIQPSEMLEALRNVSSHTAYVVGHEFEVSGKFPYGEGQYHSEGSLIVCRVVGNKHTYKHPRLPWEGTDHFVVDGVVIEAHLVKRIGSTYLWKLVVSSISPPPQVNVNWKTALLDETQIGPIPLPQAPHTDVAGRLRNDVLYFEMLNTVTLQGYRSGVLLTCGSRKVSFMAPKSIIAAVSALASGKERNEALFRTLLNRTHRLITDASLPTDNIEQVAMLITAIAFVMNLQFENDLMHTITSNYGSLIDMHRRLITLNPVRSYSVVVLGSLGIMFFVADGFVGVFAKSPHHVVSFIALGTGLILLSCGVYIYCVRIRRPPNADDWAMSVTVDEDPIYVSQPIEAPPLEIPASTNFKPPAPIREGSEFKLLPVPDKDKKPTPSTAAGWVFDTLVPRVFASTREAEVSGITNRVLKPVPPLDGECLELYEELFANDSRFQLEKFIHVEDNSVLRNRWVQRYPENVRAQLREAYQRLRATRPTKKMLKSKAFIKRELQVTMTDDGFAKKAPRIISGPSDEAKIVMGPAYWEMSNQLAEEWDGAKVPICYARGRSAEYLGKLVETFVAEDGTLHEGYVLLSNDMSVYDSSCRDEHFAPIDSKLPAMGFNPQTMSFVNLKHTAGVTANGVSYRADEQVIDSGEPRTNLYGTIINAAVHVGAYKSLLERSSLMVDLKLMLVGGDDNFSVLQYNGDLELLRLGLTEAIKGFGFVCTPIISRNLYDVDFYSKLFWPTSDGLVLSPKPGRLLPKLGHTIIPNGGLAEYKGKLLSLQNDVQHIPLLNSYFKYAIRALNRENPKLKIIRPKHEEHVIHVEKTHKSCSATERFFCERYDLTMGEAARFDEMLKSIGKPTAVLPVETWLKRVFEIDSA